MAKRDKKSKYLVLDLGSRYIKLLTGVYDSEKIVINKAYTLDTPEGAYSSGIFYDIDAVIASLKILLNEKRIKEKKCIVTFNSKDIIQKEMIMPKLSYEDTIGLIRYEIAQYLPIDVDEYDVTYKYLSKMTDEDGAEKFNVLSYIIKKDVIDNLYTFVNSCGLQAVFLDLHSNAVSKAVRFLKANLPKSDFSQIKENQTFVLIDFGYKNILIDIFVDDDVVLSRSIDMGLFDQDFLISQKLKIDLSDAENIRLEKLSQDFPELNALFIKLQYVDFTQNDIDKSEYNLGEGIMNSDEKLLFEILRDCLAQYYEISSEISKILQYYISRDKNNSIDQVLFHGVAACNESLIEFFSSLLDFNVESLHIDNISGLSFPENTQKLNSYFNAIGAIIRQRGV